MPASRDSKSHTTNLPPTQGRQSRKPGVRESLPKGFWRAPSQSLRVQVRVTGFDPVVKSFPLFKDAPDERQKQLLAATEWAARTRSSLLGGSFVSTREAETITLGDALRALKATGLRGKASNVAKDVSRIDQILNDEISKRPLASLQTTDIARYRDKLSEEFLARQTNMRIEQLEKQHASAANAAKLGLRKRITDLRYLKNLRSAADDGSRSDTEREAARVRARHIEATEGIGGPARTTLSNKLQLISRALKHARQTINGVPSIEPVKLPPASPGRERRVRQHELQRLLTEAASFDAKLPLLIRFAIETALRRERILEFRLSYLRTIGRGQKAIVFPRTLERRKHTGIIPVTKALDEIIALAVGARTDNVCDDGPLFNIKPLTLDTWWKRLLERCGINDLHFHDLRHEATSRLFERGLSTIEVMSVTGHSTNEMVDRYSHYSAGLVLDKLEQGIELTAILDEVKFLARQYLANGGKLPQLRSALEFD